MAKLNSEELGTLIDKIRGSTPKGELQKEVEVIIKNDEEKAKVKAKADKKILDDIKAAEKKLKEDAIKEELDKKKKAKLTGEEEEEKSEGDSEDEDEEDEEEDADDIIKNLTEKMDKMAKEIKALKKRKNYRTPAPKGKNIDANDLPDFIKTNTQNMDNTEYEMVV